MLTKEYLVSEYIDNKLSSVQIGKKLGVSNVNVLYWLRKHSIPVRHPYDPICKERMALTAGMNFTKHNLTKEYLQENFLSKRKTINQIAAEFGCGYSSVYKRLQKYKLPIRLSDQRQKATRVRTANDTKQFQKRLLPLYGYQCAICGYSKFVNCHHIDRWSVSENNDVSNGIVLCPNHHWEADYGIITADELRKFQKPANPSV